MAAPGIPTLIAEIDADGVVTIAFEGDAETTGIRAVARDSREVGEAGYFPSRADVEASTLHAGQNPSWTQDLGANMAFNVAAIAYGDDGSSPLVHYVLGQPNGIAAPDQEEAEAAPGLDYLADVAITSPAVNDVLVYDGTSFVNAPSPAAVPDLFNDTAKSANYTIVSGDKGKSFIWTNTIALTLPAAADKFWFSAYNAGTGMVTVGSLIRLLPGEWVRVGSDGSSFFVLDARLDVPMLSVDRPPVTAGSRDDEFASGSLAAGWSWTNQGGASATFANSKLILLAPANSGNQLRILSQAASGSWKDRTKLTMSGAAINNIEVGMLVGRSGKYLSNAIGVTSGVVQLETYRWTSVTTVTGAAVNGGDFKQMFGGSGLYFEVEYDGTNVIFRVSSNGVHFWQPYSEAAATHLGGAPTEVGLYAQTNTLSTPVANVCDWYRRIS